MVFSTLPATARALHRFSRSFMEHCDGYEEASPPEIRFSEPALCLPDDPERVIAYQEETTEFEDRARLAGTVSQHLPTTLHYFSDVKIIDGVVYKGVSRAVVANRFKRRSFVYGDPLDLDQALLCTNPVIDRYFGHWLLDGRLLEILASQHGLEPLAISGLQWMHERGYRDMLGHVRKVPAFVRVKELVIANDRGINEGWRSRGVLLRQRLRSFLPAIADQAGAPVFVRRGVSGSGRDLSNEVDLMNFLEGRGFTIIEPEAMEPKDIALALAQAPLIVLVEGSAQIHALLAAKASATIICIMPPRRMNAFGKVQADGLGVGWAYTVADDRPDGAFHQPLDRIARLIDLVG